jgi:hypothetical protein
MYNQILSNVAQGFSPENYSAQHGIVNDDIASFAGMTGIYSRNSPILEVDIKWSAVRYGRHTVCMSRDQIQA